jgi:LPXTG-motif cell wall-anchored protein
LKRLMPLAAILAMMLVAAAPAIAQVSQEGDQEGDSGDVGQSSTVTSSGSSADQCAAILAAAQGGNSQNQTDLVQSDGSEADDFEFDESGSTLAVNPEVAEECEQVINQAAAAGPAPKAPPTQKAAPAPQGAPAPKSETKAEAAKAAEAKSEAKKSEEKKALPKTGGEDATLFALGVGTLMVASGLLARRISR